MSAGRKSQFKPAAPEMMKVIEDQADLLRQTREALYTLWLHAGSVRKKAGAA